MIAISRPWYNGSYTMASKPIKYLELHYTMIQFLIIGYTTWEGFVISGPWPVKFMPIFRPGLWNPYAFLKIHIRFQTFEETDRRCLTGALLF